MASGLPVIASDNGGPSEIVENGKSGILVPGGNIEAFAGAIIKIAGDRQLAADLSEGGKLRSKDFNIKTTAEKAGKIYDSLI